jgi:hypothetical protein
MARGDSAAAKKANEMRFSLIEQEDEHFGIEAVTTNNCSNSQRAKDAPI